MKRAKRKPVPIKPLYVAWDGTLSATPKTPSDPTLSQFAESLKIKHNYRHTSKTRSWVRADGSIEFNPAWLK